MLLWRLNSVWLGRASGYTAAVNNTLQELPKFANIIMKESHEATVQFVKIVERFPVLYDNKMPHRNQVCVVAWEKVADSVKREIKEDCTVEEAKCKWKGIRSSFTRFKKKLHEEGKEGLAKQYYLYDALQFLHAHTKPKWQSPSANEDNSDEYDETDRWSRDAAQIRTYRNNRDPLAIDKKVTIKLEPVDEAPIEVTQTSSESRANLLENLNNLKRERDSDNGATSSKIQKIEENTDLQFLKSIIPDIAHFTTQEKRKFKIGILKLIDEIEETRKQAADCVPDNN